MQGDEAEGEMTADVRQVQGGAPQEWHPYFLKPCMRSTSFWAALA
jgi:hypothetical protein